MIKNMWQQQSGDYQASPWTQSNWAGGAPQQMPNYGNNMPVMGGGSDMVGGARPNPWQGKLPGTVAPSNTWGVMPIRETGPDLGGDPWGNYKRPGGVVDPGFVNKMPTSWDDEEWKRKMLAGGMNPDDRQYAGGTPNFYSGGAGGVSDFNGPQFQQPNFGINQPNMGMPRMDNGIPGFGAAQPNSGFNDFLRQTQMQQNPQPMPGLDQMVRSPMVSSPTTPGYGSKFTEIGQPVPNLGMNRRSPFSFAE